MTSYKETLNYYQRNVMGRIERLYYVLKDNDKQEIVKAFNELVISSGKGKAFNLKVEGNKLVDEQ